MSNFRSFFLLTKNNFLGFRKQQGNLEEDKNQYILNRNFYTWNDQQYRDFIMDVLRNLEPRFERAGTTIINELDEFGEIIFIQKGIILLGYEINKVRNHCIKMKDRCVIGAYGVTFNQRAVYIYYAHTNVEGFFLRRKVWLDLMEEYDELSTVIRQHVLLDYLMNIRTKMNVLKNKDIQGIIDREDHQTILAVQEKQMNNQRI